MNGSGSVPMFPVRFAVRGSVPEPHCYSLTIGAILAAILIPYTWTMDKSAEFLLHRPQKEDHSLISFLEITVSGCHNFSGTIF